MPFDFFSAFGPLGAVRRGRPPFVVPPTIPPIPPIPPHPPFVGGPDLNRFPWSLFRRGSRARRGDVRAAILVLLNEGPRNGYQLIQELEQRTRGAWRPSPGSIYPTLEQLEDEGLVRARADDAGQRRTFVLTDEGKEYVKTHAADLGEPWQTLDGGSDDADPRAEVMDLFKQVGVAMAQVVHNGNAAQIVKAKKVLSNAKRELYRLLAEDDEET